MAKSRKVKIFALWLFIFVAVSGDDNFIEKFIANTSIDFF